MKEIVNVKDYRGNYKKLMIDGDKIYLGKMSFEFNLRKLISLISLYDLRITKEYNRKNKNGK